MSTLEALIQAGQSLPYAERQKLINALRLDAVPDDQRARRAAIRQGAKPAVLSKPTTATRKGTIK